MLSWAVVLFLMALLAAIIGFGGVLPAALGIYKALSFIFLVGLFLVVTSSLHDADSHPESEE
jgi:uncharacterized membrane protein YtjA (UPF0391 family)